MVVVSILRCAADRLEPRSPLPLILHLHCNSTLHCTAIIDCNALKCTAMLDCDNVCIKVHYSKLRVTIS